MGDNLRSTQRHEIIFENDYKTIRKVEKDRKQYISLEIKKMMNLSIQQLNNLTQFRFLNIIPHENYYQNSQNPILIYADRQKHLMKENQLNSENAKLIALQLALLCAELQNRNMLFFFNSITQLYLIDNQVYVSLIEYDFGQTEVRQSQLQIFKEFLLNQFCDKIPQLQDVLHENQSFEPIIDFLLNINGRLDIIDHLNTPYQNLLGYIFKVNEFISIYEFNKSTVKSFIRPKSFLQADEAIDNELVYKTQRFNQGDEQSICREIEILEKTYRSSYFVATFAYLRIKQKVFFFMRKYVGTLAENLEMLQNLNHEQRQKIVFQISYRILQAISEMQKFKIIHRDLKLENLFLNKQDLQQTQILIGDFDCSKILLNPQNDYDRDMSRNHQSNTFKYDAPETTYSFKYDIFQFGLITLTIANLNEYIGNSNMGCRYISEQEHESFYSKESLLQNLVLKQYPPEFIEILSKCLKRNPHIRPTTEELLNYIRPLYFLKRIRLQNTTKSV